MQIQPGIRDNRWSGERSGGGEREGGEVTKRDEEKTDC